MTAGHDRRLRLMHVGVHESANANAGDTLLFDATRQMIESVVGPVSWTRQQLWQSFTEHDAARANRDLDGIVLGGGGVLLRDQAGSNTAASGWQWNASIDAVERIQVPLVVCAIGYNRFRGQPDFDRPFNEHLAATIRRAAYFGLRNSGSRRAVQGHVPERLHGRLSVLYCPTTMLDQLLPRTHRPSSTRQNAPVLGVNFALDRLGLRLPGQPDAYFLRVARAVSSMQLAGWDVVTLRHKPIDAEAEQWLDAVGVTYRAVDLAAAAPSTIVAAYRRLDVVLAMRGHGQLIPVGLGIPVVTLVTHDKLAWFLEDAGHPEWGVEMTDPDLELKLVDLLDRANGDPWRGLAGALQRRLAEHNTKELGDVTTALLGAPRAPSERTTHRQAGAQDAD